jgi:hypothetical protein
MLNKALRREEMTQATEEKREEVASKVKKLLALSASANEAESKLAAEKAREILEKYSMTMTDVEILSSEMVDQDFTLPRFSAGHVGQPVKKLDAWHDHLLSLMGKYYFVKVVLSNKHDGMHVHFLGAKEDVQVAQYVFNFLHNRIYFLTDEAIVALPSKSFMDSGQQRRWRTDFGIGVVVSLRNMHFNKVKSAPAAVSSNGTDLMVVKGQALDTFLKEKFPSLHYGKAKTRSMSHDAYSRGIEAGKGININQGLNNGQGQRALA